MLEMEITGGGDGSLWAKNFKRLICVEEYDPNTELRGNGLALEPYTGGDLIMPPLTLIINKYV